MAMGGAAGIAGLANIAGGVVGGAGPGDAEGGVGGAAPCNSRSAEPEITRVYSPGPLAAGRCALAIGAAGIGAGAAAVGAGTAGAGSAESVRNSWVNPPPGAAEGAVEATGAGEKEASAGL